MDQSEIEVWLRKARKKAKHSNARYLNPGHYNVSVREDPERPGFWTWLTEHRVTGEKEYGRERYRSEDDAFRAALEQLP